jgi:hypothetical protein
MFFMSDCWWNDYCAELLTGAMVGRLVMRCVRVKLESPMCRSTLYAGAGFPSVHVFDLGIGAGPTCIERDAKNTAFKTFFDVAASPTFPSAAPPPAASGKKTENRPHYAEQHRKWKQDHI